MEDGVAVAPLPPLDANILSTVVKQYDGETLAVSGCDGPVYHGQGQAAFTMGFTYKGTFSLGRMHGNGRIEWSNGVVYEGNLEHNRLIGTGAFLWPTGATYIGNVQNGKRQGYGVFTNKARPNNVDGGNLAVMKRTVSDSEVLCKTSDEEQANRSIPVLPPLVFSSEMFNAAPTEDALANCYNARYEGNWDNNLPHGQGELVYDAELQAKYTGNFSKGLRHGIGAMQYPSGGVYKGHWENDIKSGTGIMTWVDSNGHQTEIYDGEWKNDQQNGQGKHVWLSNPPTSSIVIERNWYHGNFKDGQRNGFGIFYYLNGAKYEGGWNNNVKHGYGVFFYEDGRMVAGMFSNDRILDSDKEIVTSDTSSQGSVDSTLPSRLNLFILDLVQNFVSTDNNEREKVVRAVENTALRLNSELRALYRKYTLGDNNDSSTASQDSDAPCLLDISAFRRLLSTTHIFIGTSNCRLLLEELRLAQRKCVAARIVAKGWNNFAFDEEHIDAKAKPPVAGSTAPFVLLTFRDFVELLVRIAAVSLNQKRLEGNLTTETSSRTTQALAGEFSSLCESILRATISADDDVIYRQLYNIDVVNQVDAHETELLAVMNAAIAIDTKFTIDKDSDDDSNILPVKVSLRSLLSLLCQRSAFTSSFTMRDAIVALNKYLSVDTSLKESCYHDEEEEKSQASSLDISLLDLQVPFPEFCEAIAIVLLAKEHSDDTSKDDQRPLPNIFREFVTKTMKEIQSTQ